MMKKTIRILSKDKDLPFQFIPCKRILTGILMLFSTVIIYAQLYISNEAKVYGTMYVVEKTDTLKSSRILKVKDPNIVSTVKKKSNKNLDLSTPKKSSIKIKYKSIVLKYKNSKKDLISSVDHIENFAISSSFQHFSKAIMHKKIVLCIVLNNILFLKHSVVDTPWKKDYFYKYSSTRAPPIFSI